MVMNWSPLASVVVVGDEGLRRLPVSDGRFLLRSFESRLRGSVEYLDDPFGEVLLSALGSLLPVPLALGDDVDTDVCDLRFPCGREPVLTDPAPEFVARPFALRRSGQPPVLIRRCEAGDLRVVLEAEAVPAAFRGELTDHPGVVAQGLVVERGAFDGPLVAVGILLLAVDEPVTQPPGGGVRDDQDLLAEMAPGIDGHAW